MPDPIREALEAAGEAARVSLALDTTCPQAGGYFTLLDLHTLQAVCVRDVAADEQEVPA